LRVDTINLVQSILSNQFVQLSQLCTIKQEILQIALIKCGWYRVFCSTLYCL